MHVVGTILRNDELERNVKKQFPDVEFTYVRKVNELASLESVDVLLTYGDDVTPDVISRMPNLKWIMVMSAGIEKLPIRVLKARKIIVTNARGIHKIPMAEFVFAFILQHAKQLHVFLAQQRENVWNRKVQQQEIYGRTLLVVGAGAIGSQISTYGKAFGMYTIGINRSGNSNPDFDETYSIDQLNDILPNADYIVSVLPNTVHTNKVFTKEQFLHMKRTAVFINVGRGNAVNEIELMNALNEGQLAHAFLDVFETEPLPVDHPFWPSEKVTITPHLSAITDMYLPRAYEIFVKNLRNYIEQGENWVNLVDLNRGY